MINFLYINNLSLRNRIFLALFFITLFFSALISVVSIFHFKNEAEEYHEERLNRKENAVKEHIEYILKNSKVTLKQENAFKIFRNKIFELSDIHGLEINFFSTSGNLILSSNPYYFSNKKSLKLKPYIISNLRSSSSQRILFTRLNEKDENVISSYSYIKNYQLKNIAILHIPYVESDDFYKEELENFLKRYAQVYFIMFVLSLFLSYLLSNNIIRSLTKISNKLAMTQLNERNEKLALLPGNQEINVLINSYNNMVDKLEASAHKLAISEREIAWREMAKQVAHEIKNPLTPMKLTVQSFLRKFDSKDPNINQKLQDFTEVIIQQIDTMSHVANAFSDFASMPTQINETFDLVKITKNTLDVFDENYIEFKYNRDEIFINFDKNQYIRIITNLIKNAIQAFSENEENKKIEVTLVKENNLINIFIKDNGSGIEADLQDRIFTPKFTTKSSGMGLGLSIVKKIIDNYNGTITFESEKNKGTTFHITLNDNI